MKTRQRKTVWTYRGCIIFRNTEPGYKLKYSARTSVANVAADTLKGIKQLISKHENI